MSGLACMCKCVQCGADLQACSLEEKKVAKYFRHHSKKTPSDRGACSCSSKEANEKALHQMAKQIIQEEKKVYVPGKYITLKETGIKKVPWGVVKDIKMFRLHPKKCVEAVNVEIEKHLDGFTPDAILETERGKLLVEFLVTHAVDAEKKEKVKRYGSAMLEIDLREWMEKPISIEELRSFITCKNKNRQWIYYPLTDKVKARAKEYYENHEKLIKYRKDEAERLEREKQAEAERIEREKREEERRERNIKFGNEQIKNLFEPQNYAAVLNSLRDDDSFLNFYRDNCLTSWYSFAKDYQDTGEVPFFIDIPITGEMIFKCDRRIWQSIIFNKYVYSQIGYKARFDTTGVFNVLKNDYQIPVEWYLMYELEDPSQCDSGSQSKKINLRKDVIDRYIFYLEGLGFVAGYEDRSGRYNNELMLVKARATIDPPNQKYATWLIKALQEIDRNSPDVDGLILDSVDEQEMNDMILRIEERKRAMEIMRPREALRQEELTPKQDSTNQQVDRGHEKEQVDTERRFQCRCCKADFKLGSLMFYTSKTGEEIKVCIRCFHNSERIERTIKKTAPQQAKQQKECEQFSMFGKQY